MRPQLALTAVTIVMLLADAASAQPATVQIAAAGAPPPTQETTLFGVPIPPSTDPFVDPEFAVSVSAESGFAAINDRSRWNEELTAAGYAPLEGWGGELGGRLSLHLRGWELSLQPSYVMGAVGDLERMPSYSTFSLMTELGYDFLPEMAVTLGPTLGVGLLHTSVCTHGEPDAAGASEAGAPLFRQILADSGRESCLDADSFAVRGGVVIGVRVPTSMNTLNGTFYANLRPTFSWPLYSSDYELHGSDLPSFEGPKPPHPSFAVRLEVGLMFGEGRR